MFLGLPNEDMEMLNAAVDIIGKKLESFSPEDPCTPLHCPASCTQTCEHTCVGSCEGTLKVLH